MGHRKYSAPRRGSLAFAPRKRAGELLPPVKYWPDTRKDVGLKGFIAYKAGTTTVFYIDDIPNSPTQGSEIASAATVLVTPPMYVVGATLYGMDKSGSLKELGKTFAEEVPTSVTERIRGIKHSSGLSDVERVLDKVAEVRAIVASIPRDAGLEQKKPFILEIAVAGNPKEAYDYVRKRFGSKVTFAEVFRPGQFVDVIGVTKGHGFQGVVARFGVRVLPRKQRKTRRAVGAIGGRKPPYVTRFVPRAGQMGFHRRTEFNKRILAIYEDGSQLTPKGGLKHFGVIRTSCALLEGSVPGTPKRPLVIRVPAKPPSYELGEPKVAAVAHGEEVLVKA